MFKKGRQKLTRRLFKSLISIAAVGLILMLIIPIIRKKQEETKEVKIEEALSIPSTKEVKEKKEIKKEVTKTIEKIERREVKKEKAVKKQKPAEPVKEVPEVSVPKVKVKKEMPKKVKEEIPKAIEITKPERKDAEKETKILKNAQDIEEMSGLIIEETMTKVGYEFYEKFFSFWEAPEGIRGYNIYINERASPMWGSLVYVKVNNTLVWERMIRPRSEDVEKAVKNSIGVVKNYLYKKEDDYERKVMNEMYGKHSF